MLANLVAEIKAISYHKTIEESSQNVRRLFENSLY